MSQIARGSYKTGVTVGRIPKPLGIGRGEPLARRLQQADPGAIIRDGDRKS